MPPGFFPGIPEKTRDLFFGFSPQPGPFNDSGRITFYGGTSAAHIEELAGLVVDELNRAADDISPAEVERPRAQMKSGLLMGLESASSRAERLARLVGIWNRVPPLKETIEKIDAVNVGAVRELAGNLAVKSNAAMALYGPAEAAPSLESLHARLVG